MNETDLIALKRKHPRARLAFAATILERMFLMYPIFVTAEGFGDVAVARRCVDFVWEGSRGAPVAPEELQSLSASLDAITPDMDDYGDLLGALALDLIAAIGSALDAVMDESKTESVARVSEKAVDSIDMFIQLRDYDNLERGALEKHIAGDAFMQRELERQRLCLVLLGEAPPSAEVIDELRADAERSPAIERAALEAVVASIVEAPRH